MIEVSVIISFRGDESTLLWTLEGFSRQRLPADMSLTVGVGGDGCAPPNYTPAPDVSNGRIRFDLRTFPRSGAARVRNLLLEGDCSEVIIFVNHDTRPTEDFVEAHVRRILSLAPGSMVLGSAPYEPAAQKTVFDVLKEESPMIFFYDSMEPNRLYDYRQAWTLNLAVRLSDFRRGGGFSEALRPYGYEDLDLAFRIMGDGAAIYYEPQAQVAHRHPLTLDQYLDREEALGSVAPVLSRVNPPVFRGLFGTSDLDGLARDYRTWVAMDRAAHRWTYDRLRQWTDEPRAVLGAEGSPERKRLLPTLYQMHIPLKRLAFRLGFLRGLELMDDSRWLERGPAGLWKQAIQ